MGARTSFVAALGIAILLATPVSGCSTSGSGGAQACDAANACPSGQTCRQGSCVVADAGSTGGAGGGGSAGGGGTSGSGGSAGGSGGAAGGSGGGSAMDLGGTWAAKLQLAATPQSQPGGVTTLCPAAQKGTVTLYMLYGLQQSPSDPKSLQVQAHVCQLELPRVTSMVGSCDTSAANFVTTELQILAPLAKALPGIPLGAGSAKLDGTAPGANAAFSTLKFVAGAGTTGAGLPSWDTGSSACSGFTIGHTSLCDTSCVQSCADLRDDDSDGDPGVTLGVCGLSSADKANNVACNIQTPSQGGATLQGRVFVDLEVDATLAGAVKSAQEIAGALDGSVAYKVVGADVWLSGAQLSVTATVSSLAQFAVDPTQSSYRMLRVDGKNGAADWNLPSAVDAACGAVVAHAGDF